MGMHNTDKSIASFARACFTYALDIKQDLWFATKDTISKIYDHTFKDIFADIFEAEYKEKLDAAGIEYFYTLIDDAVACGTRRFCTPGIITAHIMEYVDGVSFFIISKTNELFLAQVALGFFLSFSDYSQGVAYESNRICVGNVFAFPELPGMCDGFECGEWT